MAIFITGVAPNGVRNIEERSSISIRKEIFK
jgi:hypothetical protein